MRHIEIRATCNLLNQDIKSYELIKYTLGTNYVKI